MHIDGGSSGFVVAAPDWDVFLETSTCAEALAIPNVVAILWQVH